MMKRTLALVSTALFCAGRVMGQVTVDLILVNPMPSELSTWERDPTLLQIVITNADATDYLNAGLSFVVRDEATDAVVVQSEDARIPRFDVPALSAVTRFGPDIYRGTAVTVDQRIRDITITTNRLPEGDYRFCVRLVDLNGVNIANTGEVCRSFTVIIPDPPELILPDDNTIVADHYPTFRWTPVYIIPGIEEARYRLLITQVLEGQTPRDAIDRNTPHFDAIVNTNAYSYGVADPPFDFGQRDRPYAWQVQALTRDDLPAARNDGKSGIRTFFVDSTTADLQLSVSAPPSMLFDPEVTTYPIRIDLRTFDTDVTIDHATVTLLQGLRIYENQSIPEIEGMLIHALGSYTYFLDYTFSADAQLRYLGNRDYLDFTAVFAVEGHIQGGNEIVRREQEVPLMMCRRTAGSGSLSSSVSSSSPMPLAFSPATIRHPVSFRLYGEGCRSITVTRAVGTWTYPDGRSLEVEEDLRPSNIVVAPGEARIWDKTVAFDLVTQQELLQRFGGNEVRIGMSYAFEGVDERGGAYATVIDADFEVRIRRTSFTATVSSPSGFPLNFSPGVSTHPVTFSFANNSAGDITVLGIVATWYKPDGTSTSVRDDEAPNVLVPAGQSRTWDTHFPVDSAMQEFLLRLSGGDEVQVRTSYVFTGSDGAGGGEEVTAQPDIVYNVRRNAGQQFVVFGIPGDVGYYPGMTSHTITYNLDLYPSAPAPVALNIVRTTIRNQDGSVYRGPDSTVLDPAINLPVGGVMTSEAQLTVSDQERDALLAGGAEERTVTATVEFIGSNTLGQTVNASANPITMRVFRTAEGAGADRYTLIAGVAYIVGTDRTTITNAGDLRTLNGPATLVLVPDPFDSTTSQVPVELTNLTFDMSADRRLTAGLVLAESPPNSMLLSLCGGILKLTRISYDHDRPDSTRLRADNAYVSLGRSRIDLLDLVINRSGLSLRNASIEQSMFGLTFRFTEMQSGKEGNRRLLAFTTHVRLKGKPRDDEFVSAPLKLYDNGDHSGHFTPTPALQLIRNTHYLDFHDFEFKKEADNWFMKVTVRSDYPPPFRSLGTLETSFKIDQDGNITGEIAPIREMTPGIEAGDGTYVAVGEFANVDLTYFGLLLSIVDGRIDEDHSRVGLAADFYFNDGTRDWHRVSVGDATNPGVYIDFTGNVNWAAITIARDKKIKVGPAYVKLSSFIVNPEPDTTRPYFFLLSGGLGLDFERVDGELNFQSIRVKENGRFDMHEAIIRGGMFNIVDIIGVSLDSLDFKDEPSDLTFKRKRNGRSEDYTVNVDSYFRLAGAALNIGPSGDGGSGRFKELLLYTREGNKNMVLRQAEVTIAGCVIKADCQYVTDDPDLGTAMSLAGTVHTPKFEGIVVGKGGETPLGEPSYGLFIAVGGLNIQLGPVTLDQLGGGFFYNPLESDLELVRTACGINRPEIRDSIRTRRPPGAGDPGSFAAMVYAGAFVGSRDVANGRALLTVTENSMSVDMELNVLRGVGEGAAYTVFGWDPTYLEGVIRFEMDYHSIVTAEVEVDFYAYSSEVWGVNGTSPVRILCLVEADADFFVGPPGFMLSTSLEMGFDVGVLSAHAGIETMVWWQRNVSWGAYMKVWAEGEILWGLAGVAGSLEGALIGEPDYLMYCVGRFRAEVCWVEVFDGSIWVTVGARGFDGGTGRNQKYDDLIAEARDMANQMEGDMEELSTALDAAQSSLLGMSNEQITRAGQALMTVMTENALATALYHLSYKTDHDDYEGTATTQSVLQSILFGRTPRNNRWWVDTVATGKQTLAQSEEAIQDAIEALNARRQRMQRRLEGYRNLLTDQLPTVQDFQYSNPVGNAQYAVVNINGVARNVRYGFEFDTTRAQRNDENVQASREANDAFEQRLFGLTGQFKSNLDTIDNLLYGGTEPIRSISRDYTEAFEQINDYYTDAIDYFYDVQNLAATHRSSLRGRQADIRAAIHTQTEAVGPNNNALWRVRTLADLREGTLQSLESTYNPVRQGNTLADWKTFADTLGVLMWYSVPEAGFTDLIGRSISSRDTTREVFEQTRRAFVGSWSDYTGTLEGIYSRTSRLYELLFDLYDQLSFTATQLPLSDFMRRLLGNPTPRQYYGAARDNIGTYLQVPAVGSFTGSAQSTTDNSAKVTFSYSASHPRGIAEYAYKLKYPPVQGGGGGFIMGGPRFRSVGTDTRTNLLLVQEYGTARPDRPGDYEILLRARARSGYSITRAGTVTVEYSTGSTVTHTLSSADATAPSTPSVTDGGQYTSATGMLSGRWSSFDGQSGVQEYQYAVETQTPVLIGGRWLPLPLMIRDWTSVGGMTELNIRDLHLQHNKTYWIKVRAKNGAGLWSNDGRSDGIAVDTSAPSAPTALEFRRSSSPSLQNRLYFRWTTARDNESGIDRYEYCVGRRAYANDIKDWGTTDYTNITTGALPLYDRDSVFLTLKAVNGAGLPAIDTALTVISFQDTSAPSRPEISQAYYRVSDSTFIAHWNASDPESGVAECQYSFTTSNRGDLWTTWTTNGRANSLALKTHPRPVSVRIKAINGIRLSSSSSHDVEKR